ncbi:MAG TPA: hypothetical protein VN026_15380, partial [Bacteroidia bacterium]|nr:hypothetical protein [Bacteroidia bacterium]
EESVLAHIKKELKQVYPNIKVTTDEILKVLSNEVVKREIVDGEEAADAKKKIAKANKRMEKIKIEKSKDETIPKIVSLGNENQ